MHKMSFFLIKRCFDPAFMVNIIIRLQVILNHQNKSIINRIRRISSTETIKKYDILIWLLITSTNNYNFGSFLALAFQF